MSEKSKLSNRSVERLIEAGKAGEHRCSASRGLVLRIKASGVWTWNVRRSQNGRDYRLDLGKEWTLDEAREIAQEADTRVRAEMEPWLRGERQWIEYLEDRRRAKLGLPPAPKVVEKVRIPFVPTLSWDTAVEMHHAEMTRTRREITAYSYRADLRGAEMKRFQLKDVKDISRQDVAEAVAEIFKRGAERKAQTTVAAVRSLFKFLGRDDIGRKSGVEFGRMAELRAPERTFVEDDDDDGCQSAWNVDPQSAPNIDPSCADLIV